MSSEDTRVQVEIGGRTYTLRGDRDPRAVKELAAFVDQRMAEIAEQTLTVDTTRVAILAALNIADELFASRDGKGDGGAARRHAVRDRELCKLLDEVLVG
jgi:cell division protein ZapA